MSLLVAPLDQNSAVGTFTPTLQKIYGRLRTVVSAADGALWVTTTNRDGHGHPVPDDDRVIRIQSSATGNGSVV
jgi:hypothetical protein